MIKKIAFVVMVLAGSWLALGIILIAGWVLVGASHLLAELIGAWFLVLIVIGYEYLIKRVDK